MLSKSLRERESELTKPIDSSKLPMYRVAGARKGRDLKFLKMIRGGFEASDFNIHNTKIAIEQARRRRIQKAIMDRAKKESTLQNRKIQLAAMGRPGQKELARLNAGGSLVETKSEKFLRQRKAQLAAMRSGRGNAELDRIRSEENRRKLKEGRFTTKTQTGRPMRTSVSQPTAARPGARREMINPYAGQGKPLSLRPQKATPLSHTVIDSATGKPRRSNAISVSTPQKVGPGSLADATAKQRAGATDLAAATAKAAKAKEAAAKKAAEAKQRAAAKKAAAEKRARAQKAAAEELKAAKKK